MEPEVGYYDIVIHINRDFEQSFIFPFDITGYDFEAHLKLPDVEEPIDMTIGIDDTLDVVTMSLAKSVTAEFTVSVAGKYELVQTNPLNKEINIIEGNAKIKAVIK